MKPNVILVPDLCPQYRPMSITTFEAPCSPSAENQEVILPSPQHSRAPLGPPCFVFVLSLLSSKEILVMCIRCESKVDVVLTAKT